MAVWGGLTNSCEKKRSEKQRKSEKQIHTHLNAEYQRIARRDKKAFLSDQCKEIEQNNRMRKTGDLFKKIRDIKRPFHAKMGSIKDRNGMDLTEAKGYTNTLCQNHLHPFQKSHPYWPLAWPLWKFLRAIWESVSKAMFLNKTLNRLNSRLLCGFFDRYTGCHINKGASILIVEALWFTNL